MIRLVVAAVLLGAVAEGDLLKETLFLQRLKPPGRRGGVGRVNDDFPFVAKLDVHLTTEVPQDEFLEVSSGSEAHFELFPRSLAKFMLTTPVDMMTLVLAGGQWKESRWGRAPVHLYPAGATVVAAANPSVNTPMEIRSLWEKLTNTMGGPMCGNFRRLTTPRFHSRLPRKFWESSEFWSNNESNRTSTIPEDTNGGDGVLLVGGLPTEPICTENLAPLAKLLPCRQKAGLLSLFQPVELANTEFKMLQLTASKKKVGDSGGPTTLNLTISLVTVMRAKPQTSDGMREHLVERFASYEPCVATDESKIYVRTAVNAPTGAGRLTTRQLDNFSRLDEYETNTLAQLFRKGAALREADGSAVGNPELSLLHLETFDESTDGLKVWRDEVSSAKAPSESPRLRSAFVITIENRSPGAKNVRYYDSLPGFMRPLLHTLEVEHVVLQGPARGMIIKKAKGPEALAKFGIPWEPTANSDLPSTIALGDTYFPSNSRLSIRFDVYKQHLYESQYTFSPDKGEDVGSALLLHWPNKEFVWRNSEDNGIGRKSPHFRFTEGMIVLIAIPDFSMPFKAVAFSCTALLVFFGMIFRTTVVPAAIYQRYRKFLLTPL